MHLTSSGNDVTDGIAADTSCTDALESKSATSSSSSGGCNSNKDGEYDEYDDRDSTWYDRTILSQTYDDEVHRHVESALVEVHQHVGPPTQPVDGVDGDVVDNNCKWAPLFDPNALSQDEGNRKCFPYSTKKKPRGRAKCMDGTDRHGTCTCGGMVNPVKKAACGCSNAKCKICTRSYRAHRMHMKKKDYTEMKM